MRQSPLLHLAMALVLACVAPEARAGAVALLAETLGPERAAAIARVATQWDAAERTLASDRAQRGSPHRAFVLRALGQRAGAPAGPADFDPGWALEATFPSGDATPDLPRSVAPPARSSSPPAARPRGPARNRDP